MENMLKVLLDVAITYFSLFLEMKFSWLKNLKKTRKFSIIKLILTYTGTTKYSKEAYTLGRHWGALLVCLLLTIKTFHSSSKRRLKQIEFHSDRSSILKFQNEVRL